MINAVIVDDEKNCRDTLSSLLEKNCPQINNIAQCKSVNEGINCIRRLKPELVFLDVEMPDGTGFNLLDQIGEINFEVIFTTAYEQYAVKAFKFSALDYLMKPVNSKELVDAISRFENLKNKSDSNVQLQLLLANLKTIKGGFHKIAIPTTEGLILLDINNTLRLESDGNYTNFITLKTKHIVSKSLKEYEELLTDNNFLRIHQSHLINLNWVKKYVRGEGGYVVMNDGTSVPVSARKKQEVLEKLTHF
jgi:two-component system LytT family response regulator